MGRLALIFAAQMGNVLIKVAISMGYGMDLAFVFIRMVRLNTWGIGKTRRLRMAVSLFSKKTGRLGIEVK
jgi:hypothetical protein